MPMLFPTSPVIGQVFTVGARSWVWNGATWDAPRTDNPPLAIPTGNVIINGAFDIWQRGTSFSYTTPTIPYTADRWNVTNAGGSGTPAFTISRQSGSGSPAQYCMRFQRNSGSTATTFGYLAYNVESVDWIPLAGRPVTFSFHARAGANFSPSSSVLNFRLATGTGTDQNLNNTGFTGQVNTDSTATLTTSWQRYTMTITAPSSTTQFGVQFWSQFTGTAGANDWYEITGVQLESGTVATPFKRNAPSIAAELAACQRYYTRVGAGQSFGRFAYGHAVTTAQWNGLITLPTPMRVPPTVSASGAGQLSDGATGYGALTINSVISRFDATLQTSPSNIVPIVINGTGLVAFRPMFLEASNDANAFIQFNSEL